MSAGIALSRIVPPIIADVPEIAGGVAGDIFMPAIDPLVEEGFGVLAIAAVQVVARSAAATSVMAFFTLDLPLP